MAMKLLFVIGCLLVAVNAGTYGGGQKTSLEDIEKDYTTSGQSSIYSQATKTNAAPIVSPTKFGFVPQRTASSYAATKPKHQYTQTNYQVKKSSYKPRTSQSQQQFYATQYVQPTPKVSYQQQYTLGNGQQYVVPEKYPSTTDYSQQYSSESQQYLTQQQAQEYAYVQPESPQQYTVQYQQPSSQQYQQYDNVQYIADNAIAQPEGKVYNSQQPQYYYVQQYQSPSNAVESVLDPNGAQYVMYIPSNAPNSIPVDQKYLEQYTTNSEPQLPPVTTTVQKYTTALSNKNSGAKQFVSQEDVQYEVPSTKNHYQQQQDILIKREPKSLLDSYIPSIHQLQYLRQQGKSSYSKL